MRERERGERRGNKKKRKEKGRVQQGDIFHPSYEREQKKNVFFFCTIVAVVGGRSKQQRLIFTQ